MQLSLLTCAAVPWSKGWGLLPDQLLCPSASTSARLSYRAEGWSPLASKKRIGKQGPGSYWAGCWELLQDEKSLWPSGEGGRGMAA